MRLDQVESEIGDALTALSATAYVQVGGEVWTESPIPLTPTWEPETTQHLAYSVVVSQSTSLDMERDTPGGVTRVSSTVSIFWAYSIRPMQALDDSRLQLRSAGDIIALVNDEVGNWSNETDGDAVATLLTAYELVAVVGSAGAPFQIARVVFRVDHELSL